ncbi:cryptochrome/photolyase family protein [Pseudidiomarina sp.]|uniref:cryptochrome/photolyase family protein n=1 Tax=Pseudidiomarina sp. TaxID=2081707 RepID=UPI00299CDA87|nr:FAD-binding domain-containing protein [Pseudidiomarina sp.]MDX1705546.1 FAD-binding domain-containing protein [Pseudidiomarina sp.]
MAAGIWFKGDLRLTDNPAVTAALGERADELPVHALYLAAAGQWQRHDWAPIKVDLLWRHLECFRQNAAERGVLLHIVVIDTWKEAPRAVLQFCQQYDIDALHFNREYPVDEQRRDRAVAAWLAEHDISCQGYHGLLLVPPVLEPSTENAYYQKFTPFNRAWREHLTLSGIPAPEAMPKLDCRSQLPDMPECPHERRDSSAWQVGEDAAQQQLQTFIDEQVACYHEDRDNPALDNTSRLSPYWELGILSPVTAARKLQQLSPDFPHGLNKGADTWLTELAWREFYQHLMHHIPRLSYKKAFKQHTDDFPWRDSDEDFERWCEGRTGYPIVDAGMRQLAAEGWMHNRLRMIVANFLVKDLRLDWRRGEQFFMQHLIDGSFPANNGGWQWSASTGTDAVPYFRVFNPTRQSEKIDPDGSYIRKWVSELKDCPTKCIHAPESWLRTQPDNDYPAPMVDHSEAREKFLAAFKQL